MMGLTCKQIQGGDHSGIFRDTLYTKNVKGEFWEFNAESDIRECFHKLKENKVNHATLRTLVSV